MASWLALLRNDLRRRVRNRSAIISAVLAPLAMAVVFSTLVGGTGGADRYEIGVAAASSDESTQAVVRALTGSSSGPVRFVRAGSAARARRDVDRGALDAAIVLPAGFGGASAAGELQVLRDPDRLVSGGIAESVASGLSQRAERITRIVGAMAANGAAVDDELLGRARAVGSSLRITADSERGELDAGAYFGASMSIIFLFFTVGYVGTSLHVERRTGTLDRVLSTPTAPSSVVTAKAASVGLIGLVGFCVVWAVTTWGFGASWGAPLPVLATITATVVAVAGVAVLAVSLARTEQQTEAVTAAVAFTLAILGGNFVGPGQAPELLARLGVLTPNGWALRTFSDISTGVATGRDVVVATAALLGFGVAGGAVGLWRLHRLVAR